MRLIYDKPRRMLIRVGCILPLTPWIVFFHYLGLPDYSGGSHGASAMYSVASQLFKVNLAFSAVSLLTIVCGDADDDFKKIVAIFVVLHFFLFDYCLLTTAVAYV